MSPGVETTLASAEKNEISQGKVVGELVSFQGRTHQPIQPEIVHSEGMKGPLL